MEKWYSGPGIHTLGLSPFSVLCLPLVRNGRLAAQQQHFVLGVHQEPVPALLPPGIERLPLDRRPLAVPPHPGLKCAFDGVGWAIWKLWSQTMVWLM